MAQRVANSLMATLPHLGWFLLSKLCREIPWWDSIITEIRIQIPHGTLFPLYRSTTSVPWRKASWPGFRCVPAVAKSPYASHGNCFPRSPSSRPDCNTALLHLARGPHPPKAINFETYQKSKHLITNKYKHISNCLFHVTSASKIHIHYAYIYICICNTHTHTHIHPFLHGKYASVIHQYTPGLQLHFLLCHGSHDYRAGGARLAHGSTSVQRVARWVKKWPTVTDPSRPGNPKISGTKLTGLVLLGIFFPITYRKMVV